jgi:hypothetical protein
LAGWLAGWLDGWLHWLAGWLADWLAGWLAGWQVCWLASCDSLVINDACTGALNLTVDVFSKSDYR